MRPAGSTSVFLAGPSASTSVCLVMLSQGWHSSIPNRGFGGATWSRPRAVAGEPAESPSSAQASTMVRAALRSADTKGVYMASPARRNQDEGADRVITSVARAEKTAIDAVRDFVETVNRAFPDVGDDRGPRQQIIDSAFKMTEQLVGASNELAHRVVKAGHVAAKRVPGRKSAARRAAARKTAPRKAAAKKTAAPKAAAKKTAAPKAAAKKTAARETPSD